MFIPTPLNAENIAKALACAPDMSEMLFSADVSKLTASSLIKLQANGAVRSYDAEGFRYLTQNPNKQGSRWAERAQKGDKILWVIHLATNKWVGLCVNGVVEEL